jgi:hypothetical protein
MELEHDMFDSYRIHGGDIKNKCTSKCDELKKYCDKECKTDDCKRKCHNVYANCANVCLLSENVLSKNENVENVENQHSQHSLPIETNIIDVKEEKKCIEWNWNVFLLYFLSMLLAIIVFKIRLNY